MFWYNIRIILRDKEFMFGWLSIPLLLGGVIFFMEEPPELAPIWDLEVVIVAENPSSAAGFQDYLLSLNENIQVQHLDEAEAVYRLETEQVDGVFFLEEEPRLVVAVPDWPQRLLLEAANQYIQRRQTQAATSTVEVDFPYPDSRVRVLDKVAENEDIRVKLGSFGIILVFALGSAPAFKRTQNLRSGGGMPSSRLLIAPQSRVKQFLQTLAGICLLQGCFALLTGGILLLVFPITPSGNWALIILPLLSSILFTTVAGGFSSLFLPGDAKTRELTFNGIVMMLSGAIGFHLAAIRTPFVLTLMRINPLTLLATVLTEIWSAGGGGTSLKWLLPILLLTGIMLGLSLRALRRQSDEYV